MVAKNDAAMIEIPRKLEKVRANGWVGTKTELTSYVESLKKWEEAFGTAPRD